MTSIDEVVSRSRQPEAFSEHKRFTLARSRGIQKMRQFALADPHFYILELIQASVANGATYIDIQCDKDSMGLSYVGGGYHEHQLTQLFDFLVASREDVEHGDLRLLALLATRASAGPRRSSGCGVPRSPSARVHPR